MPTMVIHITTGLRLAWVLAGALSLACEPTTGAGPVSVPGPVDGLHETPARDDRGPQAAPTVGKASKRTSHHGSEHAGHGRR
jgi:hypothetical protein